MRIVYCGIDIQTLEVSAPFGFAHNFVIRYHDITWVNSPKKLDVNGAPTGCRPPIVSPSSEVELP